MTSRWVASGAATVLAFALIACAGAPGDDIEGAGNERAVLDTGEMPGSEGAGEHGASEHGEEGEGEHGAAGHDEGEEAGIYVARDETWDRTRRGARLVLSFDASRNAFVGSVTNTTERTVCAVRVEVHLDSGTELGPTPRIDVPARGTIAVELPTGGEGFRTWTAHPELSPCSSGS